MIHGISIGILGKAGITFIYDQMKKFFYNGAFDFIYGEVIQRTVLFPNTAIMCQLSTASNPRSAETIPSTVDETAMTNIKNKFSSFKTSTTGPSKIPSNTFATIFPPCLSLRISQPCQLL